jgi:hypothetical protein
MTVGPVPAPRSFDGPAQLGRWAVRLAVGTVAVLVPAYTILGVALATGGQEAISDNWIGYLGGFALVGGLAVSLMAFLMALAVRLRHREVRLLWLPLSLFPALALVVAAVELFWME